MILLGMQAVPGSNSTSRTFYWEDLDIKKFYGHSSSSADSKRAIVGSRQKNRTLSTGKLPPMDSVVRITAHPHMTSAVTVDLKLQIGQTNKQLSAVEIVSVLSVIFLINKYYFRP